jgi:transcriptional regulator with XRE-family HTH domain
MKFEKSEFAQTLGKRVREVRKYRGFTLEKLALEAEMELKQLSRIEYGKINTSVFQIYRLCYSLNVNLGELFEEIPLKDAKSSKSVNI